MLREPKSASVTERTTFGARATPGPRVFTFGCFEVGTPLSEGVPYAVCRSWPQRAIPADCQRRPRAAWLVGGHRSRKSGARLSSGGWVRWYGLPRRQPWPVVGSGRFLGVGTASGPTAGRNAQTTPNGCVSVWAPGGPLWLYGERGRPGPASGPAAPVGACQWPFGCSNWHSDVQAVTGWVGEGAGAKPSGLPPIRENWMRVA